MRMLLLFVAFSFLACQSSVQQSLADSDSLVIRFNASSSFAERTISTTNKTAIKKLANLIEGEAIRKMSCGFDGMLFFYSNDTQKDSVLFNYSEKGCRFFHPIDNNAQPVKMSDEAAAFLQALHKGQSWY
jgi:hypothetical protein